MQFFFTDHVLDRDRRELRRGTEAIAVEPQVFDVLVCLLERRDHVVTKDDLIDSVWGGRIVSESTLTSRINAARKAVGDSGRDQTLIRTIARKGFRFVGEVRIQPAGPGAPAPVNDLADQPDPAARPALPPLDRPAIAVLPFANMSDEAEQEYFSDGISEDIITALSKLRWFYVIARNSSFVYKNKAVPIKQVAEELGVGYVLEGSVRKEGSRVRITAQLSDVSTGIHIWSDHYDRSLADVFAVQDEITQAIVAAIEPQLYAAENFRAERKTPDSMDAWELVMRALSHYWRVTRQDNMVAQALLEKAISIDPNYGQALGLLAASHLFGAHMGWTTMAEAIPIGERAALAAIRADSEDPWAHYALGSVYLFTRSSTIRWRNSNWRRGSIRVFRRPAAFTAWCWLIAAAGRKARSRPARPCASVRAIPLRRFIAVSPPTLNMSGATTTRRSGCRASRSGNAATLSGPTGYWWRRPG